MLALAAQPNNHAPHSVLVAVAVVVVRPFVLGVRAIMASSSTVVRPHRRLLVLLLLHAAAA